MFGSDHPPASRAALPSEVLWQPGTHLPGGGLARAGLERLYDDHLDRVRAVGHRLVGSATDEAESLLRASFVEVLGGWNQHAGKSTEATHVARVACRVALRALRARDPMRPIGTQERWERVRVTFSRATWVALTSAGKAVSARVVSPLSSVEDAVGALLEREATPSGVLCLTARA